MGNDEWGHKVSNFKLIIVRINGGLTGVSVPPHRPRQGYVCFGVKAFFGSDT
jgi:hypothetical protein